MVIFVLLPFKRLYLVLLVWYVGLIILNEVCFVSFGAEFCNGSHFSIIT